MQKICRNAIIASRPGVTYKTPQFIGRIARRGQTRAVNVWELIREGTIDEGVVASSLLKILESNLAKSIERGRKN